MLEYDKNQKINFNNYYSKNRKFSIKNIKTENLSTFKENIDSNINIKIRKKQNFTITKQFNFLYQKKSIKEVNKKQLNKQKRKFDFKKKVRKIIQKHHWMKLINKYLNYPNLKTKNITGYYSYFGYKEK